MKTKESSSLNPVHHAYLIIGQRQSFRDFFDRFLIEQLGIDKVSNPDIKFFSSTNISIEEVRQIKESEELKNFTGKSKIFVIESDFITVEAQNALLKIFEEPSQGTHFFLNLSQDIIIPTLKSRVYTIRLSIEEDPHLNFNQDSLSEKLDKIKKLTDRISKENLSKQDAIYFVNKIELELYNEGVEKNFQKLLACQNARNYLYDRGAPVKMILESLILSV